MGIRIYTEKVKVPGSLFQEYALISQLSNKYFIKHIRFIDPIIDDDGNIFPFVRKDHIIFIDGLSVSIKSLANFLDTVINEAYTDYPTSIYTKKEGPDPLKELIQALSKIDVITITRIHETMLHVFPKDLAFNSPWSCFLNFLTSIGYDSNEINFENEITDFD